MTVSFFFFILALISMLGVLGSLLFGVIAMTKGGEEDRKTSNKLMRMRIILQGAAILFLFISYNAR